MLSYIFNCLKVKSYLYNIMPLLNSGENVQLCIFIFDPRGFIWVTGFLAHGYLIYLQDGTCVGVSTYSFNPVCFV